MVGMYGDIVIESTNTAQLVVDPSIQPLLQGWKQIGDIPITIETLSIDKLIPKKLFSKELNTVEASLRLGLTCTLYTIKCRMYTAVYASVYVYAIYFMYVIHYNRI